MRSWKSKEGTPPTPDVSENAGNPENGRPTAESSANRNLVPSARSSRSLKRRKSLSPASKEGSFFSKRTRPARLSSERTGTVTKRSRMPSSKSKRSPSRRLPRDKFSSYSRGDTKDPIPERSRDERYYSVEKFAVNRATFRCPEKEVILDRDNLKNIVVNMRDAPSGCDTIRRDIINPENITVVRRAGEGSRPIFDRDEIKNNSRKFREEGEEEEGPDRGGLFAESPVESGRRPSSRERFRSRDPYVEEDRGGRGRDAASSRYSQRDFVSHSSDRHGQDRSKYGRRSRSQERRRSHERKRSRERRRRSLERRSPERRRSHERRDRLADRDYRRKRMGGRSNASSFRRQASPAEVRRSSARRPRSPERDLEPRHREQELPPEEEYAPAEYQGEAHGYYEGEAIESHLATPAIAGGGPLQFRGRGPAVPLVRAGEVIIRGGHRVRPVRAVFLPRVPGMGRRLPFHPRLMRPIVRPLIRVIAPVLPVRPPVLPVRHSVIPLPFQCEAFR